MIMLTIITIMIILHCCPIAPGKPPWWISQRNLQRGQYTNTCCLFSSCVLVHEMEPKDIILLMFCFLMPWPKDIELGLLHFLVTSKKLCVERTRAKERNGEFIYYFPMQASLIMSLGSIRRDLRVIMMVMMKAIFTSGSMGHQMLPRSRQYTT